MSYEEKLFHDSKAFLRETLYERMQTYMGLTFCIKNDIFLCIYTCFSE